LDWLTSLPVSLLVIAWLTITIGVALVARVGVPALVPRAEHDSVVPIVAPLMPALGAAFGILMALTVASGAADLRSAQEIVAGEAAAASRLAWSATSPGVGSEPIHTALFDYLEATRALEWHGDDAADGEPRVAATLATLERSVRAEAARDDLSTSESTELITSLDALTSGRRSRLSAASNDIPDLYVITLLASGVALIINAGALGVRSSLRTSLLMIGLASVVGLSLALMFSLSAPWRGGFVVSGEALDAIMADLRSGFFR
jgi:hypothetical protein